MANPASPIYIYDPSTYIFTYQSTDKVIRIVDKNGKVKQTISVCRYQKSGVAGSSLSISLQDNDVDYKLLFASNTDALTALSNLKQAIDTLKVNCAQTVSGGSGATDEALPITLLQYATDQGNSDLIALQWYDVSDTTNALLPTTVHVFRVFAKKEDDAYPKGQILPNGAYVTLDVINNKIIDYFDPAINVTLTNGNFSGNTFTDSTDCYILNDSQIKAVNSSGIIAENGSTINCNTCTVVKATNNSNVKLLGASNATFDNIQQDITTTNISLSNVDINRNTSIGKAGRTVNIDEADKTIKSYKELIDQDFNFTTSDNEITLKLENPFPQANGVFRIKLGGAGTDNKINVVSANNTALYTIVEKGSTAVFNYNITTTQFEFIGVLRKDVTSSKTVQFLSPTSGQVNFTLGVPVTQASEIEMYINGAKQIYGVDYSYNSTFDYIIYSNAGYTIDTTDRVEFRVY